MIDSHRNVDIIAEHTCASVRHLSVILMWMWILKIRILVVLSNFIEKCNLLPHLGNSYLPVHRIVGGEEAVLFFFFNF